MSESPIKERWPGTARPTASNVITERELIEACHRSDAGIPEPCDVETVKQLLELVWEHHAHGVLADNLLVCPVCSKEPWRSLLDKCWNRRNANPPNDGTKRSGGQ